MRKRKTSIRITPKNQESKRAEKIIDECNASILDALQRIESIPEESRNGGLGIYLSRTIATMEISSNIKDAWSTIFSRRDAGVKQLDPICFTNSIRLERGSVKHSKVK
ncbi:hypothetical protein L9Z17_15140 [Leptospira noguchii]|nr:hypothetical protein [Leptospira noguchii]